MEQVMCLIVQRFLLLICYTSHHLIASWVLCYLRAFAKEVEVLVELLCASKVANVSQKLFGSEVAERVFDTRDPVVS